MQDKTIKELTDLEEREVNFKFSNKEILKFKKSQSAYLLDGLLGMGFYSPVA